MGIDEAGDEDEARDVEDAGAVVGGADAGDPVAGDRHVTVDHAAGNEVEDPAAAQHQIRRLVATGLGDAAFEVVVPVGHVTCPSNRVADRV